MTCQENILKYGLIEAFLNKRTLNSSLVTISNITYCSFMNKKELLVRTALTIIALYFLADGWVGIGERATNYDYVKVTLSSLFIIFNQISSSLKAK